MPATRIPAVQSPAARTSVAQPRAVPASRRAGGATAYAAGRMGEDSVLRDYLARGYSKVAARWRGAGGEIDLIMERDREYVFVEVKSAARHADAVMRISAQQIERICNAALEFCGRLPQALLTPMRFDAALVDGQGRVEILENAFAMG
ncbi:hypothetical protein GL279_13275 [Paracoccus limosus]|uniref:Uncharacterized protein n=2 Tax=Paracoccus limosus TaxID=913252 RepID=A0A844H7J3_9RHOB|nr:hypothetical protein [Paracoccus limosus]